MTPAHAVKVATINRDTIGVDAYTPHNPVIVGDKLYISWYQAGVQIFDLVDPTNPVHLGAYDTFAGGAGVPGQYLGGYGGNWGVFPFLARTRCCCRTWNQVCSSSTRAPPCPSRPSLR
jgi:hypothetical protein